MILSRKLFIAGMGLLVCGLVLQAGPATAQKIETTKSLKATAVKNQANSGTCWSFATVSFLESEMLRLNKGKHDLSEMFNVYHAYLDKAERYIRLGGKASLSPGGQAHDVLDVIRTYGMVPEEAFSGLKDDKDLHDHSALDEALVNVMKSALDRQENACNDSPWRQRADSVLTARLGSLPETFTFKGNQYTALSYARELGINPDDYIELTSYSHHPWYKNIVLEVPDNWSAGSYFNLPLDDLMRVMENAISNGYTFCWDGDVSCEPRFSQNDGVATLTAYPNGISAEIRQHAFDDFSTTDDHLMHITGLGKDEQGKTYFLTKNSWSEKKGNKGYWWMSDDFVRLNTIAILVHKEALPADLRTKLKLD